MIIRSSPIRAYTALPNSIFRDRRLSLDTKGLLGYLLSLPPNWEIRPQLIAKALSPEGGKRRVGRERLQRMFTEMQAAGYMAKSKDQSHRDGGYWGSFTYLVGADPEAVKNEATAQGVTFSPQSALPSTAEPSTAEPSTDKRKKESNNLNLQIDLNLQTERTEFQFAEASLAEAPRGCPKGGPPKRRYVINGDRGRFEVEIANRLGPDGFELLMLLSPAEIDQLCAAQRSGTLDDAALNRVRNNLTLGRPR